MPITGYARSCQNVTSQHWFQSLKWVLPPIDRWHDGESMCCRWFQSLKWVLPPIDTSR